MDFRVRWWKGKSKTVSDLKWWEMKPESALDTSLLLSRTKTQSNRGWFGFPFAN